MTKKMLDVIKPYKKIPSKNTVPDRLEQTKVKNTRKYISIK